MFCPNCRSQNPDDANFCRKCGTDLRLVLTAPVKQDSACKHYYGESLAKAKSTDPDELTAGGIANVIIGDGFFMVAVLLSATHNSVSSLLWLFLLIPAFFFFGKGFADVLHAKQIQGGQKGSELNGMAKAAQLLLPQVSLIDAINKRTSRELAAIPSVTEGTTRELE